MIWESRCPKTRYFISFIIFTIEYPNITSNLLYDTWMIHNIPKTIISVPVLLTYIHHSPLHFIHIDRWIQVINSYILFAINLFLYNNNEHNNGNDDYNNGSSTIFIKIYVIPRMKWILLLLYWVSKIKSNEVRKFTKTRVEMTLHRLRFSIFRSFLRFIFLYFQIRNFTSTRPYFLFLVRDQGPILLKNYSTLTSIIFQLICLFT